MNNQRRKAIRKAINSLLVVSKYEELDKIRNAIDDILIDEETAFDCMPENLQYSYRGEMSQDSINILEDAESMIDNLTEKNFMNSINEIVDKLEEIE